jgi:hypothetical protein
MADTGKDTVDGSTTDSSTPEVQESNNHQLTQALQDIAKTQLELSHIIETMQRGIAREIRMQTPKLPTGHDVMIKLARAANAKIKTFADVAAESLPTEHTQQYILSQHSKAKEALHLPEIAENILSNPPPMDLLRAQLVDKTMFHIIQGSLVLQQNLFLKPRSTGPFEIFPETKFIRVAGSLDGTEFYKCPPSGEMEALVEEHTKTNTANMYLSIKGGHRYRPLGSRIASMLICQPPIYVMQVIMPCCPAGKFDMDTKTVDSDGHFVLKAEHGITNKHIDDAIRTVRSLHWSCNSRKQGLISDSKLYPEFHAMVKLEQGESILVRWQKFIAENPKFIGHYAWRAGMYTNTRRDHDVFDQGLILTFSFSYTLSYDPVDHGVVCKRSSDCNGGRRTRDLRRCRSRWTQPTTHNPRRITHHTQLTRHGLTDWYDGIPERMILRAWK